MRGEEHSRAVLTYAIVRKIRQRRRRALNRQLPRTALPHGHPDSYPQLAKEFGVHPSTLCQAVNGGTWKTIKQRAAAERKSK